MPCNVGIAALWCLPPPASALLTCGCRAARAAACTGQVGVQGTVAYLAPEVIDGTRTKAADVYSYGVLLWQLVTGQRPFENLMPEQVGG